jgi:hypothetical protein
MKEYDLRPFKAFGRYGGALAQEMFTPEERKQRASVAANVRWENLKKERLSEAESRRRGRLALRIVNELGLMAEWTKAAADAVIKDIRKTRDPE